MQSANCDLVRNEARSADRLCSTGRGCSGVAVLVSSPQNEAIDLDAGRKALDLRLCRPLLRIGPAGMCKGQAASVAARQTAVATSTVLVAGPAAALMRAKEPCISSA
ncbi:hypothetical protein ACPOLB_25770 [Rubrivivax sp. RP6-9]|uniref:hypothetical protein n=1 Tax=Rubrivivax sp. RP6-9 TaxID=3415750 RepID=UPI003CC502C4